jgi:hypothetical protein
MWDNKSKESVYDLPPSHQKQFKRYIRDSPVRVACFLVIAPSISPAAAHAPARLKVESGTDTDVADQGTGRRSTRRCSTSRGCWTGRRWREGCGCSCGGSLGRGVVRSSRHDLSYLFLPFPPPCFCDRALPADDFETLLVRPSRNVLEAAEAAFFDVTFVVRLCASALPAALFDFFPADALRSVLDAAVAALLPVFLE